MPRHVLADDVRRFVASARVGRLATSTTQGRPHIVPVCFELLDGEIYIGLDSKPKSVDVLKLRRVRNIVSNPRAALMVDRYSDDWSQLGYVLIATAAALVVDDGERSDAVRALKRKYVQYQTLLPDDAPVIRLRPVRVSSWGDLTPWESSSASETDVSSPERAALAGHGNTPADV